MEARKSAMVESSWCRILKEAGIKNKDAEKELEKAKKRVSDEFENAKKLGVMMYDKPESRNRYRYEICTDTGTKTGTHKIETCFETQFEVDKQVYNAIKNAFLELDDDNNKEEHKGLLCKIADNCEEIGTGTESLENKEEFKGLLCKIRENCEEIGNGTGLFGIWGETGQMGQTGLIGIMIERIKGLTKEELVSLAKIVATSGLNALLEGESVRLSVDEKYKLGLGLGFEETLKESNLPSLDKFLVKHFSKLERDVEEAKRQRGNDCTSTKNRYKISVPDFEPVQSLDSILVKKHMSKLEREVYDAKNKNNKSNNDNNKNLLLEKKLNVIPPLPPRITRLQKARLETLKGFNETDHGKIETLKGFSETGQTGHDERELLEKSELKNEISERKKAKEREIMQIWGNLSLENSIKPRLSKIERDKIAWKKAEEEQKNLIGAQNSELI